LHVRLGGKVHGLVDSTAVNAQAKVAQSNTSTATTMVGVTVGRYTSTAARTGASRYALNALAENFTLFGNDRFYAEGA
jgi:hypothetical protein